MDHRIGLRTADWLIRANESIRQFFIFLIWRTQIQLRNLFDLSTIFSIIDIQFLSLVNWMLDGIPINFEVEIGLCIDSVFMCIRLNYLALLDTWSAGLLHLLYDDLHFWQLRWFFYLKTFLFNWCIHVSHYRLFVLTNIWIWSFDLWLIIAINHFFAIFNLLTGFLLHHIYLGQPNVNGVQL